MTPSSCQNTTFFRYRTNGELRFTPLCRVINVFVAASPAALASSRRDVYYSHCVHLFYGMT